MAPTPFYFDLGAEAGRGKSFPAGPDGGRNKNGFSSGNFFTHVGGDFGTGTAWQVGASYLTTSPQDRVYDDIDSTGTAVTNSFTGKSQVVGARRDPEMGAELQSDLHELQAAGRILPAQGERRSDVRHRRRLRPEGRRPEDTARRSRAGTCRASYQFMPMWRVGYRYDRLDAGTTSIGLVDSGALTAADFPILATYNPTRQTVMVDWSPSEFSRVRLQYAQDKSRSDATDNQVFLQYIVSLGAHGAHKF